jgi:hypothetical protein
MSSTENQQGKEEITDPHHFEVQRQQALALFHNQKYLEALPVFKALAAQSDEDRDWFNVLTTAGLAGDPELADSTFKMLFERTRDKIELFNKRVLEGQNSNMPTIAASLPQLCYYHASSLCEGGWADRALDPTETLVKLYCELETTDTQFLFLRGIPAFGDFLNLFQKLRGALGAAQLSSMVQLLQAKIDESGRALLANALK